MALVRLWLRRLRAERALTLGVMLLLLITAAVAAGGPRLLQRLADTALGDELAAAPAVERHAVIHERMRVQARPLEDHADVVSAGARLRDRLPPELRRLVTAQSELLETTLWQVRSATQLDSVLRLRIQDGAFERIRLVSGRLPAGPAQVIPDDRPAARPDQFAFVYEAIVPASAASEMGVGPGSRLPLAAWLSDPLNSGVNMGSAIDVVGTYELVDPGDEYWLADTTVGGWRIHTIGFNDFVETTVLLGPESHRSLAGSARREQMPLTLEYRFYLDTGLLASDALPSTAAALRRIESSTPRTGTSDTPSDTTFHSGLLRLLEAHQQTWRAAEAVLAFVGLGMLAIASATLAVVIGVAASGRRRAAALIRARGASSRQLVLATGAEALLVVLPPIALGLLLAWALVPATATQAPILLGVLVGLLAGSFLLATVAGQPPAGQAQGGTRALPRLTPRRLVVEASLVFGALAAAWLLRERGIAGSTGPDPVVAAVLGLVGFAAGLVAMRAYPLPARLLAWLAAGRRDLLPVLAVRRAVRGGSSALVLLLLVASATVGAFASATVVHLEHGARLAAWQEVGADYRIVSSTAALPAGLGEAALPGVEASAALALHGVQTSRGGAVLVSFEPADLAAVLAGTTLDVEMPAAGAGTAVPAIVGGLDARPADTLEAAINQVSVPLLVSGTSDAFPGVAAGQAFVAVSSAVLEEVMPGRAPRSNTLLLRGPPEAAAELRQAVAAIAPWLSVVSRSEREAQRLGAPVMEALRVLAALATLLAVAYAALAVGAALLLAAAAQRDETAHLRALGVGRRGAAWLSLLEYGPAALAGYVIGAMLGLGLFSFVVPALGLAAIVGTTSAVPLPIEASHLLALLGAMLTVLIAGWLAGVLVQRDTNPATAIRGGID